MPNWCNNNIKIEGPKDKIKDIWDRVQADEDMSLIHISEPTTLRRI